MLVIYSGFDKLEMAFKANISKEFDHQLADAKESAIKCNSEVLLPIDGKYLQVGKGGIGGGYAYVCDLNGDGTKWFIKRPNKNDPWGIRVSVSSSQLALYGLEGTRKYIEKTLKLFGIELEENAISISRVDFAVDILAPHLAIDRQNIVSHARSNITERDLGNEIATSGHSGRVTSITVGKMPSRQFIFYDKREEVVVKHKAHWHTIWNNSLAKKGLPPLDYSNPMASRIWRIEARAGKTYLQKKWGVRCWNSLYEKLPELMADAFEKVRYCEQTTDTNRARWPTHPIWDMAKETVATRLTEFEPLITQSEFLDISKHERIGVLEKQTLGLAVSLAAIQQTESEEFPNFLYALARQLEANSQDHYVPIEERLQKARDRYVRFHAS
ncbi:hypothetical protein GCM10008927_28760 [Amylibacter ulvae]|uniref:Replication initiation factor n=1 Tax=Paramylibacter ulvae TaxID=1651968 RepID=A0ABQ3D6Q0_9RHOB|nr:hypothetical protein [Amylibacter ulvae]GHA61511.1 hypothetical protein GCM10008927_28760 [Amylibacter ulvae]